jgi:hypothetical protein
MRTYDAPPYVAAAANGALPFIDIADQYVISGASFSPDLLEGGSLRSVASNVEAAGSAPSRAVIGAANGLTAAICAATADRPANVCQEPIVSRLEDALIHKELPNT